MPIPTDTQLDDWLFSQSLQAVPSSGGSTYSVMTKRPIFGGLCYVLTSGHSTWREAVIEALRVDGGLAAKRLLNP